MQFYEPLALKIAELSTNFKHPAFLILIPILFVVLLILVRLNFVTFSLDDKGRKRLRKLRVIVFFLRFLAVSFVCIALAAPFTVLTSESEGNPRALVLVDKSGSMEAYDTSFVKFLTDELDKHLPTTVKTFGSQLESPVGDAALGHPEHLLLISDGNANVGVNILDVAQVAQANNVSINMIDLSPVKYDAAVVIDAPQSVPLGFPAEIRTEVTSTDGSPVPLTITIDGQTFYNEPAHGIVELKPSLSTGYHRVEARITSSDSREENNAYFHVLEILEKPKVFVLSGNRGNFENALSELFDVTVGARIPGDLSQYYAVVANDQAARNIGDVNALADFLKDESGGRYGNGLVTIGGFNSFDRGGYQRSQLESLLPVKVGKAKRTIGDNSLVFVIQVSGSVGGTKTVVEDGKRTEITDAEPTIDIIKAQAVSAINSLNLKNNVGVVAFGVSNTGESFGSAQEALESSVVKIADVKPLYSHRKELLEQIPRLQGGGTTAPDVALRAAVEMLQGKSGDKTIILLTNGRFSAGLGAGDNVPAKLNTKEIVKNAYRRYGIKTQTLGVGSRDEAIFANKVDESFLKEVAQAGDSTYDRATNMASLIVKYGDPNEKGFGDNFYLVPLSLTHFITRNVELGAILNGYNEVAPKDGSKMLVSTDAGDPALTVWNYFNGRVAALTVFTASGLGPLLEGNNSDLVRNTVLWAIGDPRRKQAVTVQVDSAIVGEKTEVTFVSKEPIAGNCEDTQVNFDRSSGDTYVFTFTSGQAGFGSVCTVPYAVNHESEYWRTGENTQLQTAVHVSEGEIFTFDQVDEIVERIRTVSTRVVVEKTEVRNPFLALAVIIFLLEIFIRRLVKHRD